MKSAALLVAAGSGLAAAQSVTTDIPAPAGTSLSPEPIVVDGDFDGQGFLYDREGPSAPSHSHLPSDPSH